MINKPLDLVLNCLVYLKHLSNFWIDKDEFSRTCVIASMLSL